MRKIKSKKDPALDGSDGLRGPKLPDNADLGGRIFNFALRSSKEAHYCSSDLHIGRIKALLNTKCFT